MGTVIAGSVPDPATTGYRYEPVVGWGEGLPDTRGRDVSDITVGPNDEVYLLYREPSFVVVCGPEGDLRRTIGRDILRRPHGVTTSVDRTYVVDEGEHVVRVFDVGGREISRFGEGPSDPTFPPRGLHVDRITMAHPPFTRPTRLAIAPWGDLYVSDGYGNCRVHQFTGDGGLIRSWGEPGIGPGQFHIPHAIYVDREDRVLVCDRENDRIQLFTRDGGYIGQWIDLHRPQAVVQGRNGLYFVAEGAWRAGQVSAVHGRLPASASRIGILDGAGRVLARIGTESTEEPGGFIGAHGIGVDSRGDIYVAECVFSVLSQFPELAPPDRKAVRKLRRLLG